MKLVLNDNLINYKEFGLGNSQTIVLLHGWLDNVDSFSNISALMSDRFHLVMVDLPGMGESTLHDKEANLDFYVRIIKNLIEKLNLKPFAFIGHSFGCRILIKGVGQGTLSSDKLVLVGAAGISKVKTTRVRVLGIAAKSLKFLLNLPVLNQYKDRIRKKMYASLGSDYYASEHLKAVFKNVISEDLQKFAQQIKVPTLLIYGDKDNETPVVYGHTFNRLISGSELKTIPLGSHFVHQENPVKVADLIKNFLCN